MLISELDWFKGSTSSVKLRIIVVSAVGIFGRTFASIAKIKVQVVKPPFIMAALNRFKVNSFES